MIAWLIGIITAILIVFIVWRAASPEFRARAEAPKFRFLENLRIRNHNKNNIPREDRDESSHS
jgi:hypothetical protein